MSHANETLNSDNIGIHDRKYLMELLFWIIFGILATVFDILQSLFIFGAILYLFIEQRKRNRPKSVLGFNFKNIKADLKSNWMIVILAGCITQILAIWIMNMFAPATIPHIILRIPILGDGSVDLMSLLTLYFLLIFSTLGEELVFRVLLQNRLSWYISPLLANLTISILFGVAHFESGDIIVLLFDIIPIIIDSILFGWLWQRTKNVFIPWAAHWMADWVGLTVLLFFL